ACETRAQAGGVAADGSRLARLRRLQERVSAGPMNRTYAGTLRKEHVGQKITLAGWVAKQRDFGELVFVDLRDRTGIVQVVADQKFVAADVVAAAKELRTEFVVRIDGEVKERDVAQKNSKLPTGDVEVVASKIEILN